MAIISGGISLAFAYMFVLLAQNSVSIYTQL